MEKKLMDIYRVMYSHFGARNWWPAETPFEVIVGAILTQNVTWTNVEKAIKVLKDHNAMDLNTLVDLDPKELGEWIKSTGYYNMKAKKLQSFCRYLIIKYNGSLQEFFKLSVRELRQQLLSIYGIGQETADSIILYAAEKPIFVVDAYTRRIFSRIGILERDASYEEVQQLFMDNLPCNVKLFNEYHALIVGTGNRYCSNKKPKCRQCPLGESCSWGMNSMI